jgi:hypothetical protein
LKGKKKPPTNLRISNPLAQANPMGTEGKSEGNKDSKADLDHSSKGNDCKHLFREFVSGMVLSTLYELNVHNGCMR